MIDTVAFFMPSYSRYGGLNHFTQMICSSLQQHGIRCIVYDLKHDDLDSILSSLFNDKPDITISLGVLNPDDSQAESFFCDTIKIPHLSWIVDSPLPYRFLSRSPYTIVACVDTCDTFFDENNFAHHFFLPHAADVSLETEITTNRPYDVSYLGSCIDYKSIHHGISIIYPRHIVNMIEDIISSSLNSVEISFLDMFLRAWKSHDTEGFDMTTVYIHADLLLRGKARIAMLQSITDCDVHIWGRSPELWKQCLGNQRNIIIHEEEIEHCDITSTFQKSKIILSSTPQFSSGSHERIFSGLASGALVVTDDRPYIREHFSDDTSIALYNYSNKSTLNERIRSYLSDDSKRHEIVCEGKNIVLQNHTWDARAATLLKLLPNMVETIAKSCALSL